MGYFCPHESGSGFRTRYGSTGMIETGFLIFSTFVGHFCLLDPESGFRIRIRSHWLDWISGSETKRLQVFDISDCFGRSAVAPWPLHATPAAGVPAARATRLRQVTRGQVGTHDVTHSANMWRHSGCRYCELVASQAMWTGEVTCQVSHMT